MEDKKFEINRVEIESKWQAQWKENKVFEPKISDKPKYFGNVAYPYANSVLHIGHGRTYSIADIYLRYQRVLGKNVLQPLGFHISGTPVLAVADGVKRKDAKILKQVSDAISDYVCGDEAEKLIETFTEPENIAKFFSGTIEGSLDSIGAGIDWSRQFTTGEPLYNKFIEWQYSKLKDAGLLVQGKYPILYSAQDENAVGEDDIKDGDIDKVAVQNMVGIKFSVVGEENTFVLCATLRPDALFCAQNLWIKKSMSIAKLKVGNEFWYVACDAINKIKYQFDDVEVMDESLNGEYFMDKEVIAPIVDKQIPCYHAEFCDSKHGTGLVYSSPADSPHDYLNLFETKFPGKSLNEFVTSEPLGLTPITETKDKKGNPISYKFDIPAYDILIKRDIFNTVGNEEALEVAKQDLYKEAHFGAKMINAGEFSGLPLKNNIGGDKVRDKLIEDNQAVVFYETSRRAETRGGDNVIVANLQGQWFLNYSSEEVKAKAHDLLDNSKFFPTNLKQSQAGYIDWANMRPCARKRGLGTQIPYDRDWIIEPLSDSTIYQMLYMISHLIREKPEVIEKLSFEVFDYIYFGKGNVESLDIDLEFVKSAREQVEYWNNVDFRYVGQPHMSNHLNFLIYHYSLIFPKTMWPQTIVAGNLMMRDGQKISKSKGNGTPLFRMKNEYGSDLYRLYIGTNSNCDVEMDFKEDEIQNLSKKFDRWTELITKSLEHDKKDFNEYSDIDKWLISKFYKSVEIYFDHFENFKIREAFVEVLYEVLNNITYHTRRAGEENTIKALRFIAEDYLTLMTPITPHICEELYSKIKTSEDEFISLKSFDTNIEDFIDLEILDKEEIVFDLIKRIGSAVDRVENPEKIIISQAPQSKFELFNLIRDTLANEGKNPKLIFEKIGQTCPQYIKFSKKFVPKCLGAGISFYLDKEDEKQLLDSVKDYLVEEFKTDVEFGEETDSASPREFFIKVE